ncbi:hypothetical protein SEA_MOLLYMUR_111 [Gordonia phage Mollymur]|uniref:Uncharacterized protein n=1 Tax=Gordonia phage Mollymur TaxID=2590895 RepID=A0A4Y6E9X9_9CAUD|nr:hypothetical protein PQB84_gp015 [Gordonia phage Mollymur]QDF15471.1 hypothetical protein SEA_MOLLYMUR_111 [Gordonia phage Mollymur]
MSNSTEVETLPIGTRVDVDVTGHLNGTPGTVTAVEDGQHTVAWDDGLPDQTTWLRGELAVVDTEGNRVA